MPNKTIKPVVNIDALLAATKDLESGHPIEGVLKQHGFRYSSAYDVMRRYQKDLAYYDLALNSFYEERWRKAVKELEPVVKAIEEFLEVTA
jgi:hypothetical protein